MASGRTMTQPSPSTPPIRIRIAGPQHGQGCARTDQVPLPLPSGSSRPGGRAGCIGGRRAFAPEPRLLSLDELPIVRRIEVKKRATGGEVLHEDMADDVS